MRVALLLILADQDSLGQNNVLPLESAILATMQIHPENVKALMGRLSEATLEACRPILLPAGKAGG